MPASVVIPRSSAPTVAAAKRPWGAQVPSPASGRPVTPAHAVDVIFSRAGPALFRAPANLLLALIWLYQRTLSPALPVVFGANCGCRFSPTCSHYAAEAVRTHGALLGSFFALRRLLKCTPLHPGGFDPVPLSARARPVCHRAAPPSARQPIPTRG
jgi:putative membrane protein insertion efficiency factor